MNRASQISSYKHPSFACRLHTITDDKEGKIVEQKKNINRAIITLAIALATTAIVRSYLSIVSLYHALSLVLLTSGSTTREVYQYMFNNTKKILILTVAMLMIVVAIPTFASTASAAAAGPNDQQILQARYDLVNAHIGFMTGVMGDIVSLVPQATNLQAPSDKLNSDMTTLQGFVSSADQSGFSNFVKNTVQPDVQSANDALKTDRQQYKSWNVTAATAEQMKTDYQNRKATYDAQVNSANLALGNAVLGGYNTVLQDHATLMSNMSSKGFDVSGMQAAQNEAQSSVISPLQDALGTQNGTTVRNALKSASLGNGAPYSDHYYAKFDLAKLSSVSAKIATSTNNSSVQQQLNDVNTQLSSSSSTLGTVGTSPYAGSQQDQVWNPLKAASSELKTIIGELKAGHGTQG
jgi:hypothetical protein